MVLRGRSNKQIVRLRKHLDESFGAQGSEREKLRGLILCVRRRKPTGYEQETIAERAKLTRQSVREILAGQFDKVSWDPIEVVLKTLGADAAEITVAWELYEQFTTSARPAITVRPWSPPPSPTRSAKRPPPLFPQDSPPSRPAVLVPPPGPVTVPTPTTSTTKKADNTGQDPRPDPGDDPAPPVQGEQDRIGKEADKDHQHDPVQEIDPMDVQTVEDFTAAMELFRLMRGQRSLRKMVEHCQDVNAELKKRGLEIQAYSAASYSNVIKNGRRGKTSSKELVLSYIAGAGGTAEELEHWAKAWILLKSRAIKSRHSTVATPDRSPGSEHHRSPGP
jgi:hypothetical protein